MFNTYEGEENMIQKIRNLGNLPLIIILVAVIIVAIVLSVVKARGNQETGSNTPISDNNTDIKEEEKQPEEDLVFEENVEDIVDETEQTENKESKYFIRVNYEKNVVTIYTKDSNGNYTVPYKAMVCSTGKATPKSGTYTIPSGTYSRGTWGMMVGGVWAQYFTRIVNSILFHSVPYTAQNKWSLEYWEYDKLGTSASAGCIRLTVENAKWIYNNCPAGTKVEFYADSNPGPIEPEQPDKITEHESVRGWDPTDPDPNNPWKTYTPNEEQPEEPEENKPTTPSKPSNPSRPTTPSNPSTPTTPNPEPENPGEGTGTQEPENPGEGTGSQEPENPGEGTGSQEPENPGEGTGSQEPENPEEGTGSQEPENPGEGTGSQEPENPGEGTGSQEPENPGEGTGSQDPENPGEETGSQETTNPDEGATSEE